MRFLYLWLFPYPSPSPTVCLSLSALPAFVLPMLCFHQASQIITMRYSSLVAAIAAGASLVAAAPIGERGTVAVDYTVDYTVLEAM
jgi:hypothetical protein